ncbi:MAG: diguanylate phosphodiesterase [Frankiales bacterium]|nr:diguanylate phosphodiesterase [Frankiales bacterium]
MPHGPLDPTSTLVRPPDEDARLAVLHSFAVLDTPREERFDAVARLAAEVCGMPVALLTLVDEDRQWTKAAHGLDLDALPREVSFCAHALLEPDALTVVPDATQDPRFADNPFVTGDAHLRAYAGAPLVGSDAQPLGTLCVLDREPRTLGDRQLTALRTLATQVVAQLERDRAVRRLAQAEHVLRQHTGRPRPAGSDVEGLERALDGGELVVHYQPFWDVTERGRALTARVSGAEALVRWQHPERGLLLPAEFVPAMEAHGLASRLGETVLRASLERLAAWERAGLLPVGFRMHVNIAAQQLHEGGIAATVDRIVRETGATPGRLCLEVTESALLDAAAFSPDDAQALVDSGLALALDDFGTGFSSLTQLRSYPFSCVKVDRSFVAGLGRSEQDEVIVDTVVSMARRLGIVPVCEGVETPAQLDRVVEAGCTTVQGWLFGKACDAEAWESGVLREGEQVLLRAARPASAPALRSFEATAGVLARSV